MKVLPSAQSIANKTITEYPWWQPYHNDTILESQYRDLLSASNCTSLRCLRQLPYNTLATAIQSTYILGYQAGLYGHGDFYYGPSVDGSIILDLPSNEFERGHFSRIPLLTDRETYEGQYFLSERRSYQNLTLFLKHRSLLQQLLTHRRYGNRSRSSKSLARRATVLLHEIE